MITYNHENFIKEAIEGVLNQKCNFTFELIIGEDLSTDATRNLCEIYAKNNPAIKLLPSEKNLGVIPNLLRTIKTCSGKYIAICEGDDFWIDPLKLQKQFNYLEEHPEYVLSYHNVFAINVIDDNRTKIEIEEALFKKKPEDISVGHPTHTSSMLFRNVITNYPGDFDKIISGDSYLQFVLARYGESIFQKNIYPNVRRRHPNSVWSYKSEEYKIDQRIRLYEKLLEIAINQKEVKYLNKILVKYRTQFVKVLWNNRNRKDSLKCLTNTSNEAFKYGLFWYLVLYILNDFLSLSRGIKFLRKKFRRS